MYAYFQQNFKALKNVHECKSKVLAGMMTWNLLESDQVSTEL